MSIEDLPLEAVYLHKANGPTGALDGVQPFGSLSMSYTDSIADGPGYLLLHMLARTAGERCALGISPHANVHRPGPPLLRSPNFAYQGFGRQR